MSLPIILALGGLIGFGFSNFFWKVAGINKVYPASFMVVETLVVLIVAITIHFLQNQTFVLVPRMVGLASLAGLSAGFAIFATMSAFLVGGEASIVSPITSLGFVVVVLLAYVLLKEPVTPTKFVGSGLAIVAIILLSR